MHINAVNMPSLAVHSLKVEKHDSSEPIKNAMSPVSCTSVRHFQEMEHSHYVTMFHKHPASSYIPQKHAEIWMIMIHVRITCSLVLAGSSNSRRSTVQRHVQYSPSMSKVSECNLKGHQLLHGSSNTLPISPPNTANISSKHIKEIYKRTTTRPQTTWQCDSLPWYLSRSLALGAKCHCWSIEMVAQRWSFLKPNSPGETSDIPNSE